MYFEQRIKNELYLGNSSLLAWLTRKLKNEIMLLKSIKELVVIRLSDDVVKILTYFATSLSYLSQNSDLGFRILVLGFGVITCSIYSIRPKPTNLEFDFGRVVIREPIPNNLKSQRNEKT